MTNQVSATVPPAGVPQKRRSLLRWIAGIVGVFVVLVVVFIAFMIYRMNYVPTDLDTSTTMTSEQGLYRNSYTSQLDPIRINQIHSWTLHVETPDGQPVTDAEIAVDGDMPQHGHGLPTRPQVTENLGNGDYRVEGLKFHMPGWWIVEYTITANGQADKVTFNLLLQE